MLTHAIAAFLLHLFLELIVFFLLIVVQNGFDLRHGLFVNIAHLGEVFAAVAGGIVADGFHLGTLAFKDRLDLACWSSVRVSAFVSF